MSTTTMQKKRARSQTAQLIFVSVTLIILAALFYWLLKFIGTQAPYHTVTYIAQGSASAVVVTYTQSNGVSTKPLDVMIPWKKTIRFDQATTVILTVANPSQTGRIQCVLLLDGEPWKEGDLTSSDKTSCAGIVP